MATAQPLNRLIRNGNLNGSSPEIFKTVLGRLGEMSQSQFMHVLEESTVARVDLLNGYKPTRDVFKECDYPKRITIEMYKQLYNRCGIAARIVALWSDSCWEYEPELYDTDEAAQSPWEKAWLELNRKFDMMSYWQRIDELSGIGRFGIMLLGINDNRDLSSPVDGINVRGEKTKNNKYQLMYIRTLDESVVKIKELEKNTSNPRFDKPKVYTIKFGTTATDGFRGRSEQDVDFRRVIHICKNRKNSNIFGQPELENVYNDCLDVQKTLGADGEAVWRGGFPGLSIESQQGMDLPTPDEEKAYKDKIADYVRGFSRYLLLVNMTAKTLPSQIVDPSPHLDVHLKAISIAKRVPIRTLLGSEEAKLSSSQDSKNWNNRVMGRNKRYCTPDMIYPTLNAFEMLGILPTPKNNLVKVAWPDLNAPTGLDKAKIAAAQTDAILKYVTGFGWKIMTELYFWTEIIGMDRAQAEQVVKAAKTGRTIKLPTAAPSASTTRTTKGAKPTSGTRTGRNK